MEGSNKKILVARLLVIFLLIILMILIFLNLRNVYNNSVFYLNGEKNIYLDLNNDYLEPGFVAILNGKSIKDKVKVKSNVDTSKFGKYTVTYTLEYKYLFIKKKLIRNVYVKDLVSPELNINSDDHIYLYLNENFELPTFSANDNIDGDITDKVKVNSNIDITKIGKYNITYSVSDSSNNVTEKNIEVTVDEKQKLSYIKVSIAEQKLYYYERNKIVLSTNVVTGMKNVSPTPKGDYKVLRKARNVTLKGSNYESFVSYWIAFKGNAYGLHDASWRSRFGGNIYTYNGSHGCVNMPKNEVSKLYNMIEVGTPVYVY